jgi:Kef-type K+ transport system membrane component KefB
MNQEFLNMNLFEKLFRNIPNFIKYTFTKNIFILIIMLLPTNKYLSEYLKNKKNKNILLIIFNIIPILSIIQNWHHMIPIGINNNYNGIFLTTNWYYIFYWIFFIIIYLLSLIKYIKKRIFAWIQRKNKCFFRFGDFSLPSPALYEPPLPE